MKTLLSALGIFAVAISSTGLAAPPAEDGSILAPILAPIDAMFHGMTERDPAAIRAAALPGTILVLMRDGKPEQMTIEAFADHFSKPTKAHMEERIDHPLVRVDNDLAVVWAPFEFLVDGKKDHCGTDLFNLVHTGGKWLIAGIADTGSKGCAGE